MNCKLKYLYDPNPAKTLNHIITLAINWHAPDMALALARARDTLEQFMFPQLYGQRSEEAWDTLLEERFERFWNWSEVATSEKKAILIPIWFCDNQIKYHVPQAMLISPQQGQKIKGIEFAVILKSITQRVLTDTIHKGKDYRILSNDYFLSEGFKKHFKKKTNRSLNETKLTRITDVLAEVELIDKIRRWDDAKRQKSNLYKIGPQNAMSIIELGKCYK